MKKIKLFCLPYAGGSATIYNNWSKYLDSDIELIPIELAGRGKRFNIPLYCSLNEAISDILSTIKNELDGTPYVFFGHSMGCLLIYELVKEIRKNRYYPPIHAFLSGRYPPHMKKGKVMHLLSDDEFIKETLKLGGTPREICENKEFFLIFMSILRSDFKIIESYQFENDDTKFDFDITIFNGKKDEDVSFSDIIGWSDYTSKKCDIYEFDGGHFFINEVKEEIIRIINNTLAVY